MRKIANEKYVLKSWYSAHFKENMGITRTKFARALARELRQSPCCDEKAVRFWKQQTKAM